MKQKLVLGQKIICLNRKASFNYFFLELLEAGITLKGSEVKSLRDGKGSIADSYAVDINGELFLINSHKLVLGQKIICLNRKASFNYFFLELLEAGISLKGSEVKSLRDGKGSIADSYAVDINGELFLINSHIPLYRQSSYNNHDPKSNRKLLLNRKEINKLIGRINQDGLTLIPTKLYFLKGKVKVEIAVAKGKKLYDKRQVKKTRDWNREKARLLSKNNK